MTGLETIGITATAKGLTDLVVKPISEVLNKRLDEPFKQLIFNAFSKYIQNYNERHGIVKVLGMPEPVKLEDIYTSVQFLGQRGSWQFNPLKLEEAYRQAEGRRFQSEQCKKQDGLKVANDNKYLMVLGQPGAGKSTFLRRIGLEALKGKHGDYQHGCVPVFLELKRFTTGEVDLVTAITDEFTVCGFPNPLPTTQNFLDKGKLLILLDGLDEVPTQQLDHAINQIQDFADKYKQNRFIASCRTAAYESGFRQFVDVVMADFDDRQIQQFITNWFRSEEDRQVGTAQSCWKLLQQSAHAATKELAQTPLLLTLLCLVFDDSQNFPERRAELYKQALDILLTKWAAEKRIQRDPIYKDLTLTLETIMLGEIAYSGLEADRLFFLQREVVDQIRTFLSSNLNAPKHLDGEVILQAIQVQQGILVERTRDVFSFSHLTLQEYLAAQHIADNNQLEQLVSNHLANQRWREVFQLVAGLMRGGAEPLLLRIESQSQTFINTPNLKKLTAWANQETKDIDGRLKPFERRAIAILLASTISANLTTDNIFEMVRIRKNIAAIMVDFANLVVDIINSITNFVLLPTSTFNLNHSIHIALKLEELKVFRSANSSGLISKLKNLNIMGDRQTAPLTRNQILDIWYDALNFNPEWLNLSQAEGTNLNDYIYANELLIRCKEASVRLSPQMWADIEFRVLTVPEPSMDLEPQSVNS
jgi:hypothetical protein